MMQVSKETITPKKAMEWLKRNVHNRPLSTKTVTYYAKTMLAGEWKLNGDCVRFNGNGDLIDGQHRLNACVQAAVPFESYVIRGLDHAAFDTIDQGRKRKVCDIFARQGHKHYSTLAAATRCLWRYQKGWDIREAMPPHEANAVLEANSGLHEAVSTAREHSKIGLMSPGLLSFLIYATGQKDAAKSQEFWKNVMAGENLPKSSPAYVLRERLISNLKSVASLHDDVICALSIKGWNSFKEGKPCKQLKWDRGREEFPVIQ
jgi:hypothetical protein